MTVNGKVGAVLIISILPLPRWERIEVRVRVKLKWELL